MTSLRNTRNKAMEAKELMVGDKVLVKVLSQIPETYVPHTWCEADYTRNLQVRPIPLTAESLEKNGFDGHFLWLKEGETNGDTEYVSMEYTEEGTMFFFIRRTFNDGQFKGVVHFVHELQRALRCCGLNELAENFKVE